MSKIINEKMKNRKMSTSIGVIEFNADGIADIKDEEYVASLLELDGFELADGEELPEKAPESDPVKEDPANEENPQEDEKSPEETTPEEITEESLSEKNVPQLRKIAKDNNIDLAGATKKDEIIAVIIGAINE